MAGARCARPLKLGCEHVLQFNSIFSFNSLASLIKQANEGEFQFTQTARVQSLGDDFGALFSKEFAFSSRK
jgi:hypothetical protein